MAKSKNRRYKILGNLIEREELKTIEEIFEFIPRTRLAIDAKINYNRLGNKVINPEKFTVKDIRTIAGLLDIDPRLVFSLIINSAEKKSRKTSVR